ncbi:MAG TPA: response regulator [Candidatus Angelobacter sp.]|nr:response regulator [Candidatus Angelobacter sp.]
MHHWDPLTPLIQPIVRDPARIAAADGDGGPHSPHLPHGGKDRRKKPRPAGNRVLLFSGIFEVALYRAEVLRGHGLEVRTPRSKDEAIGVIRRGEVDVVVLTYTLPDDTVKELADLVRQYCPGCRLVAISESGGFDEAVEPDAVVIANEGPAALVAAIRRVLQVQ